jgi:predicted amidohydrolase YtcJ
MSHVLVLPFRWAAVAAACGLGVGLAAVTAAHEPAAGPRPRIGAGAGTPSGAPDTWGTYCITELAPLFRDALVLVQAAALEPQPPRPDAAVPVPAVPVPAVPLLPPLPRPAAADVGRAGEPLTVFVARRIVTMDPGWPTATAVAVQQGRIVSVGSLEDLAPWLERFPHEIDRRFADRVIYPGFVEPHTHPVMGSVAVSLPPLTYYPLRNPYDPDFPGVKTKGEAVAKLREYVAAARGPDDTVFTWGYDVVAMGGDLTTAAELDTISPTVPIVIWDASEHYAFANTRALEKYGVTAEKIRGVVGAGVLPDGRPNGQFLGTDACRILLPQVLAERLTPAAGRRSLRYLNALMQQAGVTILGDLFYGGIDLELEDRLVAEAYGGDTAWSRIVHVADGETFRKRYGARAQEEAIRLRSRSDDRIIHNGVKFFADDAFLPFSMEVEWPGYTDPAKYRGLSMYASTQDFVDALRPWWNAGFQIHVHANGSGGNQVTLDALAVLLAERPRVDHRFTFEHFGISSTAQGRRVKALGALISAQPYYVYQRADLAADAIGTDRASLASRMQSLLDQDVVVGLHSDTPVGIPSPLLQVWIAVQRIGLQSGKVHAPAERVRDVYRALRMVTTDAAYLLGVEDRVGSIEAGKLADFAILDSDPQDVDPHKIKDIAVIATVLGGRVTFTSDTRVPPAD